MSEERYELLQGDSLGVLRAWPDAVIDAVVTDPPAGIGFMGKHWDKDKGGRDAWIVWLRDIMVECLRVLKPGGHALVWALPRTSHWTATALEDAGFEIRDVGVHLFGQGMPKSLEVSKAIDKATGAERERGPVDPARAGRLVNQSGDYKTGAGWSAGSRTVTIDPPATAAAKQWSGFGTALKPASEHWILARKPLTGTVAANVLAYSTGALNIDGCRIETTENLNGGAYSGEKREKAGEWQSGDRSGGKGSGFRPGAGEYIAPTGRWPANVTLDEEAAALLDAQSGTLKSGTLKSGTRRANTGGYNGPLPKTVTGDFVANAGGASRFFYVAKPSRSEKTVGGTVANVHPTVKSVALMRWLARLITPPGGLVLDPFAGSGTTGVACIEEGFQFIGIEREDEYITVARARLVAAVSDPSATRTPR